MKYMLLMQSTRADWEAFGRMHPAEIRAHIDFMERVTGDLAKSGELCDAQGLAPPERALIVRSRRQGGPEVSDGPFAETKEFLAGYWIVDVESEARAIEIAAHVSTAPGKDGVPMDFPVVVQPVGEAPGDDV